MVLTPLLGVWLGSSLVAFYGGPTTLALIGGALLFPVLPVFWEIRATSAWNKKLQSRKQLVGTPKRWLTLSGRIILRTLFINVAFLAVLAVWFPKVAFPAVATRGDWFLEDHREPWAQQLRADLASAAGGLEWLYELATPNPYKQKGDDGPVPDSVKPVPEDTKVPLPTARRWLPGGKWKPDQPPPEPPQPKTTLPEWASWSVGDTFWPWAATPESLAGLDESSIEALGKSIAARESDPFKRVKLMHDWVVTRFTYDEEARRTLRIPPQDAETVFAKRVAVCAGYARVMVALGKVTGDEVAYVVGDVREESGAVAPVGHAWNAVKVKDQWYVVDATWDDPVAAAGAIGGNYRTDYLFIPPSLAVYDHLPDDERWQLLAKPLSRGDFLRQPLARPQLAREGLTLVSPDRSTVEVDGPLTIELLNPRGLYVLVSMAREKDDEAAGSGECGVSNDAKVSVTCELPRGVTSVRLYTNTERNGTYGSVAVIRATRR